MGVVRWARHGENEANVSRTLSHRVYDADLTDRGRRQAAALARRLATGDDPVAAIACSPLRRARQTAEVVATALGLPVAAELEDLREIDVGALDGRRDEAAWEIYDRVLAAWSAGDLSARFPDGEDGAELTRRLRRGLLTAVALPPHDPPRAPTTGAATGPGAGTVLAVAHGGNLRAALPWLTGAPAPDADLPPGEVAELDVSVGGGISLRWWPPAPPAPAHRSSPADR